MFNLYIKKNGELDSPFTAGGQNGHFFLTLKCTNNARFNLINVEPKLMYDTFKRNRGTKKFFSLKKIKLFIKLKIKLLWGAQTRLKVGLY